MIKPLGKYNIGDRPVTHREAANAVWNKLHAAMAIGLNRKYDKQMMNAIQEAWYLADAIVKEPTPLEEYFRGVEQSIAERAGEEGEWCPSDTDECHFCGKVGHSTWMSIGCGTFVVCVECQKDPDRLLDMLYENVDSQEAGQGCTLPLVAPAKRKARRKHA